jgi:hypothetical protein
MGKLLALVRRLFDAGAADRNGSPKKGDHRVLRQKQSFRNDLSVPLEIMVEPIPDRYVLQPGQEIEIEVEYQARWVPFEVAVYDGGLWISPATCAEGVWIDGKPVEPDWKTRGPNAVD